MSKTFLTDAPQEFTSEQQAEIRKKIGFYFSGHSGKPLYINSNGDVVPLVLGEGLRIVNGVLSLDIDIIESVQSLISVDGYVLLDSNGLYLKPRGAVK